MSNLDKAVDLILPYIGDCNECERIGGACLYCVREATDAAQNLADAGLLALDAPAPLTAANGNPVWRADNTLMVIRYPDGEIGMMINWLQEARYTQQAARDQAALLLAAANTMNGDTE